MIARKCKRAIACSCTADPARVGVFAIQLAWRCGAQVFTTASARNSEFLEQLGASHVIDYQTERFEDHVGKVDVVFDAVGGETLRRSWDVLKPGGRLVTIASNSEGAEDERTKAAVFHRRAQAGAIDRDRKIARCG
ncbi:MAG: zinc-binding dehydrogenase [Chthoniobacter sp.]